jgi:hypothetical protein
MAVGTWSDALNKSAVQFHINILILLPRTFLLDIPVESLTQHLPQYPGAFHA